MSLIFIPDFINLAISNAASFSGFITKSIPNSSLSIKISSEYWGALTLAMVYLAPSFLAANEQSIFTSSLLVTDITTSALLIPASWSTFKLVPLPFTPIISSFSTIECNASLLLSIIVILSSSLERNLASVYPTLPAPIIITSICFYPLSVIILSLFFLILLNYMTYW